MAVLSVCELWRGRSGDWDQKGKRSYVRIFRVKTSSQFDGQLTVMTAAGLPAMGAPYADANGVAVDVRARCTSVQPNQSDDDPWTWELVYTYETEDAKKEDESKQPGQDNGGDSGGGGQDGEPDISGVPTEVRMSFEQTTRILMEDWDGKAPVNSAGDRFDPPIEVDDARPVLIITRPAVTPAFATALFCQNAVNSDTVSMGALLIQPGQAKIRGITIEPKENYWMETWEVELRILDDPWNPLRVLNQGFHQNVNGVHKACVVKDKDGNNIEAPVEQLLDEDGVQIPLGAGPVQPTYTELKAYPEIPFGGLGIFQAAEAGLGFGGNPGPGPEGE